MAKNTPAFQFYPSDFICGTMLLSPEATGAYIRILCVLWMESNLLSFCFRKLQTITQTTPEQFERVWAEIECKFVITDGTLSHARFTQMMEISEKRRQSGLLGGRPGKQNESKTKARKKQNESKSEANSRRMKNEDRSMKNELYSSDFETFWAAFPSGRKQDKAKAAKAWNEAIKSADAESIIQAAREYAASDVGRGEFVKGPAPWLNGRCWEDDRAAWKSKDKAVGPLRGQALIDQNKSALREYAERVENGTVGDLFAMFGAAGGGNGARGNSSNGGSVPGGARRIDGPGVDGRDN